MSARHYTCVLILLSGVTFAQVPHRNTQQSWGSSDDTHEINGTIVHTPGAPVGNLFIEVQGAGGGGGSLKVPVGSDGDFSLGAVPPGSFTLRVLNQSGDVISQQIINSNSLGRIEVRLDTPPADHPSSGHVSMFELTHKVPSKAQREVKEAQKAFEKHDVDGYIAHLEEAVAIDPDYVLAQRSLAVVYLRTGRCEKAIAAFQEVIKRDDHSVPAYVGLSAAALAVRKFTDSEASARRALLMDPSNEPGHYFLGLSLYMQGDKDTEALEHLRKVSGSFPIAHVTEAQILEHMGKQSAVKSELKAYLDSGDESQRSKVKAWLSSLN